MDDQRKRLHDGSIVGEDGIVIPAIDADLMARIEAAKDASGAIHDADLANEYFEAMVAQNEAVGAQVRTRNPLEPLPPGSKVFPSVEDDDPLPQ